MGSEYFINSQTLEDKVRDLLPSQGGRGAGFDLSASTQIIPIIDLTESADGANVRQDLQTALSFNDIVTSEVQNTNTDVITTTGYWRVFGANSFNGSGRVVFTLTDASATSKIFLDHQNQQIKLCFENSETTECDILIISDGIFSKSKNLIFNNQAHIEELFETMYPKIYKKFSMGPDSYRLFEKSFIEPLTKVNNLIKDSRLINQYVARCIHRCWRFLTNCQL